MKRKFTERFNILVGIVSVVVIAVVFSMLTFDKSPSSGYYMLTSGGRVLNLVASFALARYFSKEKREERQNR